MVACSVWQTVHKWTNKKSCRRSLSWICHELEMCKQHPHTEQTERKVVTLPFESNRYYLHCMPTKPSCSDKTMTYSLCAHQSPPKLINNWILRPVNRKGSPHDDPPTHRPRYTHFVHNHKPSHPTWLQLQNKVGQIVSKARLQRREPAGRTP